jgi:hypothetical protein
LSHFYTALMRLFNQATAKPSPFAPNVLLSPNYFPLGAALLPPSHLRRPLLSVAATPTAAQSGIPSRPIGPTGAIQSP